MSRRLDQLLANLGYCSRREARAWVEAGRVEVAGRVADDPGQKSDPAVVRVDGEPLDHPEGLLLAMNKPLGRVGDTPITGIGNWKRGSE